MGMIMNLLRVSKNELDQYLNNSELLERKIYSEQIENEKCFIDIDKSWDGIIFLLTGTSSQDNNHKLFKFFFSNQLIDENQDLGYGPAHFITQDQVKEIYTQFECISINELKNKFDSTLMNQKDVYPLIWDEEEESLDYLIENFIELKEFYYLALINNQAIITILN